ncbi:MAG TPA: lysozyme [Candidatus Obscuribacterales bacterium]
MANQVLTEKKAKQISECGLKLLKEYEGLRLEAYKDSVGVLTIGYGHAIKPGESFPDWKITTEEAEELLLKDVAWAVAVVNATPNADKLNANQFDALVLLVFNIGAEAYKESTIRRYVASQRYECVPDQFMRWVRGKVNGVMVKLPGLVNRRKNEVVLWKSKA